MHSLDTELAQRLAALREQQLYRELRRVDSPQSTHIQLNGRELLNFSSNDYLGLANEPFLREAAIKAIEKYGCGSGASRLVSGSLTPHHHLEEQLALFKGCAAALTFSSGYATAVGTICALVGKDDVVIIDKLVHACIVDAVRLSQARVRVFKHNDLEQLENHLKWASAQTRVAGSAPHILIITETVFSMDGDTTPLKQIVELKERFGAWLMVDEAHATGVLGDHGRGLAAKEQVTERIEVHMGTMGKALGAAGGYICGSRTLIDYLTNRARSFIFSTAPVPAASATAAVALEFLLSSPGVARLSTLWSRLDQLTAALSKTATSAIVPIIIGEEGHALDAAARLQELGLFVPAIRFPTVARGAARLRVTLTATHSAQEVAQLIDALKRLLPAFSHASAR